MTDLFEQYLNDPERSNKGELLSDFISIPIIDIHTLSRMASRLNSVNQQYMDWNFSDVPEDATIADVLGQLASTGTIGDKPIDSIFEYGDSLLDKLLQHGLFRLADGEVLNPGVEFNIRNSDFTISYSGEDVQYHEEDVVIIPSDYCAYSSLPNGLALCQGNPFSTMITYYDAEGKIAQKRVKIKYDRDFMGSQISIPAYMGLDENKTIYLSSLEFDISSEQIAAMMDTLDQGSYQIEYPTSRSRNLNLSDLAAIGREMQVRFKGIDSVVVRGELTVAQIATEPYEYEFTASPNDITTIQSERDVMIIPSDISIGMIGIRMLGGLPEYDIEEDYVDGNIRGWVTIAFKDQNDELKQKRIPIIRIVGIEGSKIIINSSLALESSSKLTIQFEDNIDPDPDEID